MMTVDEYGGYGYGVALVEGEKKKKFKKLLLQNKEFLSISRERGVKPVDLAEAVSNDIFFRNMNKALKKARTMPKASIKKSPKVKKLRVLKKRQ